MTGWLNGLDAVFALVLLRVSLLGIVCDLAVSGLVVSIDVVSRCSFNTTGIYTALSEVHFPARVGVDSAGTLFNLITQAQGTSQVNGGLDGIFKKVNTDIHFRADTKDVVGEWRCSATGEDRSYPADTNSKDIFQSLNAEGLLFNKSWSSCWNRYPDYSTSDLFIWSASQDDFPTQPWQVRAAVDMTSSAQIEKVMRLFACNMNAPSMDWVLKQTEAQAALTSWCSEVKGNLYTLSDVAHTADLQADPSLVIASNLNNIIMNSGAAWNNEQSPLVIDDPTQGCLAPRAL
jgi:hypothetical protein